MEAGLGPVLALPEAHFAWLMEVKPRWQFTPWEPKRATILIPSIFLKGLERIGSKEFTG